MTTRTIPEPRRASLSGYVQPGKLLSWRWVEHRLTEARGYWIATHGDGFPSSRPVWGLWLDARLLFSTGSRVAANLKRDSRVQVNLGSSSEVVIVEGRAEPLRDVETAKTWAALYEEKYEWDMPPVTDDVYVVTPTRILAWLCDDSGLDGGALFANSATEWRF